VPTPVSAELASQVVRESVAVVCEWPLEQVTEATGLADVGADSLARVGIADLVEERLATQLPGLHIPDDDLARFVTVRDLAEWVATRPAGPS
jgi:acyl carrier protein